MLLEAVKAEQPEQDVAPTHGKRQKPKSEPHDHAEQHKQQHHQQQSRQEGKRVLFLSAWGRQERAEWADALSRQVLFFSLILCRLARPRAHTQVWIAPRQTTVHGFVLGISTAKIFVQRPRRPSQRHYLKIARPCRRSRFSTLKFAEPASIFTLLRVPVVTSPPHPALFAQIVREAID